MILIFGKGRFTDVLFLSISWHAGRRPFHARLHKGIQKNTRETWCLGMEKNWREMSPFKGDLRIRGIMEQKREEIKIYGRNYESGGEKWT